MTIFYYCLAYRTLSYVLVYADQRGTPVPEDITHSLYHVVFVCPEMLLHSSTSSGCRLSDSVPLLWLFLQRSNLHINNFLLGI